jgi:hypothetical protein
MKIRLGIVRHILWLYIPEQRLGLDHGIEDLERVRVPIGI